MNDLMKKIGLVSKQNGGKAVVAIQVRLGLLAGISKSHFIEHFREASVGSCAEGAKVRIRQSRKIESADAQAICLESVELAE